MKRTLGVVGDLPKSITELPIEKQLSMAEMLQHVALVQLLLLNNGSHIIDSISPESLTMHLEMKFGIRSLGDGRLQVFLATKDLGGVPPLPK
jgi:hypothetical protein